MSLIVAETQQGEGFESSPSMDKAMSSMRDAEAGKPTKKAKDNPSKNKGDPNHHGVLQRLFVFMDLGCWNIRRLGTL